jgi:hypothetical protein
LKKTIEVEVSLNHNETFNAVMELGPLDRFVAARFLIKAITENDIKQLIDLAGKKAMTEAIQDFQQFVKLIEMPAIKLPSWTVLYNIETLD